MAVIVNVDLVGGKSLNGIAGNWQILFVAHRGEGSSSTHQTANWFSNEVENLCVMQKLHATLLITPFLASDLVISVVIGCVNPVPC